MGTHGRRRRVQRARAEVCGQGEGALACLLRRPMPQLDGRLGPHQHGVIRLDGQRAREIITPDEGREWIGVEVKGMKERIGGREWRSSP